MFPMVGSGTEASSQMNVLIFHALVTGFSCVLCLTQNQSAVTMSCQLSFEKLQLSAHLLSNKDLDDRDEQHNIEKNDYF